MNYRRINILFYIKLFLFLEIFYYLFLFNFNLFLDYLTHIDILFLLLINFLSLYIFNYSIKYMNLDRYKLYFIYLLFIFLYAMKSFLLYNNLYSLFFFWEFLGLLSFFLIKFWSLSLPNSKSAIKAILINRLGDILFIYILIISDYNIFSFSHFNNTNPSFYFFLSIKSVLFFGIFWLLSAMSTPTPVSSLLHSVSMVCIGFYMKYKMNININYFYLVFFLLISLFFISFFNLKKLLALSTSFNLFLLFLSKSSLSIFHLFNHGIYKSFLFLLSGYIMHFNIDIRLLSIFLNPFLFKLFLFFFIPLPFIFISLSKDYIYIYSPFNSFLLLLFFSFFYFTFTKFSYSFFLNFPSFNYYLSFLSFPLFFFLSSRFFLKYYLSFILSFFLYRFITIYIYNK